MHAQEFVSVYPREERIWRAQGTRNQLFVQSDEWSALFGTILHDVLTTGEPQDVDQTRIDTYEGWSRDIAARFPLFIAGINSNETGKEVHHLGFHALNYSMLSCWYNLAYFDGESPADSKKVYEERKKELRSAQDSLAVLGTALYLYRDMMIKNNYSYFSEGKSHVRKNTEGTLMEIDFAILGISYALRHKNVGIVAAPIQFERNKGGRNADFILFDFENLQAAGAQVKSQYFDSHAVEKLDGSRIVPVDARKDFHAERRMRTESGTSRERMIPWGGVVAAYHAMGMQFHGKNASSLARDLPKVEQARLMQFLTLAKRDCRDLKPKTEIAYKIVADRLDRAFGFEPKAKTG